MGVVHFCQARVANLWDILFCRLMLSLLNLDINVTANLVKMVNQSKLRAALSKVAVEDKLVSRMPVVNKGTLVVQQVVVEAHHKHRSILKL